MKSSLPHPVQPEKPFIPFPDLVDSSPKKHNPLFILLLVSVCITCISALIYYLFSLKTESEYRELSPEIEASTLPSSPTPTPTPIILKPDKGREGNYNISQGSEVVGPKISKVTFDPLDPKPDEALTITISLPPDQAPTNIVGTLQSDNQLNQLQFIKKNTSDKTYEVWSLTTDINDSLLYKYILKIDASNEAGKSKTIVAPRS